MVARSENAPQSANAEPSREDAVADADVDRMQETAFCLSCDSFHDPDDLRQSFYARDELTCPNCHTVVASKYQPS